MNCSQAQAMLAAYRELKNNQVDMNGLEVHLEGCATCRDVPDRYQKVGEQVRTLPLIEPSPDSHARMMQALAAEHVRFLQQFPSAAPVPTPDYLKPYLKEQIASSSHRTTRELAAFSSAETGPLSIIQARRRRSSYTGQFIALGVAAALLMALMLGGLTSLLLLANRAPVNNAVSSIAIQSQVARAAYSTTTNYTHVVSAIADRQAIYYTAYNNDTKRWVLLQLDRSTKVSTPLLGSTTTGQLVVLGSSDNFLVWLQLDPPRVSSKKTLPHKAEVVTRTWSLRSMALDGTQASSSVLTLLTGTFNQSGVPSWVHTPVQGIWFVQNTLLVASIDLSGNAHLYNCQLDRSGGNVVEVANASKGHILTSPTANTDGTALYWGEEWASGDGTIHGNIWTQQASETTQPLSSLAAKHLFLSDEMSFHPQVVHDTLFVLSTNDAASTTQQGTSASPTPATTRKTQQTITPATAATPTGTTTASVIARADSLAYTSQVDELIHGTLLAFPLNSADDTFVTATTSITSSAPAVLDSTGAAAPQGGSRFLLWQNEKGYQMYDAVARLPVAVDNTLNNAAFLAVNGDTAVWTVPVQDTSAQASTKTTEVTFLAFNWPTRE